MSSTSTGSTTGESPSDGKPQAASGKHPRLAANSLPLVAAILWAAVIFATSCTWISRDLFVSWVWGLLPTDGARLALARFWDGGGGLAVVKGYHMAEFALLFLLGRMVALRTGREPRKAAWAAAGIAIAYAAGDEWHQTFVPDRGGTWTDVVIDVAGIGLAAIVVGRRHRNASAS